MKAVAYVARGKAELLDWPDDPRPLSDTEVAGPTLATLISPGTELNGCFDVPRDSPSVGGYAAIFTIDSVGSNVRDLHVGQRVFCMGNHVSRQRCDRREVVPILKTLSAADALLCRLMCVSWSTLSTTRARPRDLVLVCGLGIVGNLAAQIFQAFGYRVSAIEPVESRRDVAQRCGLNDVHATVDGMIDSFDLALDCSGHEAAVLDACRLARQHGEVVLIGSPWRKRSDIPAFDLIRLVNRKYLTVRSGWEWQLPRHPTEHQRASIFGNLSSAIELLATGHIRAAGLCAIRRPRDCQRAYDDLLHQRIDELCISFDWIR